MDRPALAAYRSRGFENQVGVTGCGVRLQEDVADSGFGFHNVEIISRLGDPDALCGRGRQIALASVRRVDQKRFVPLADRSPFRNQGDDVASQHGATGVAICVENGIRRN
ncbi:MAG: hypothetical protein AW11_01357 [Candidatus Accumulibacter regalis]|uniref:Uncharacterized protein n=1 Tax=Accumulibacter regalis TaxID=522306 RepID=A0A011REM6_ACCRE|nr:MAG: hypothetical protein AW11_01357 [Candidatus Accumulibacter regalis]